MHELRVYVANLGKYNVGELVGEWITLPFSPEELESLFVRIGLGQMVDGEYTHGVEVDGIFYEEYAIHDYETPFDGWKIDEYDSLENLNDTAEEWEHLYEDEQEKVAAAVEVYGYDVAEAIGNVDDFILLSDVHDEEDLGTYYVEEQGLLDDSHPLSGYFDYEAYGRDVCLNDGGGFTEYGYIVEVR